MRAGQGVAAVRTGCHIQDTDVRVARLQDAGAAGEVRFSGHEKQFVIGDFQNIALIQPPGDFPAGAFFVRPERRAKVRIEGNECACLSGKADGLTSGGAAGLIRQGKRAEVKNAAVLQQPAVKIFFGEADIGARFAVKAEVPVSVCKSVHQSQCCRDFRVTGEPANVDPGLFDCFGKHCAEAVRTDAADKSALFPKLSQHGKNIGGGAAGVCFKEGIALIAFPVLGKVYQQFTKGDDVKFRLLIKDRVRHVRRVPFLWSEFFEITEQPAKTAGFQPDFRQVNSFGRCIRAAVI